jgi:tetratricopeptide (TPR) repeat protein
MRIIKLIIYTILFTLISNSCGILTKKAVQKPIKITRSERDSLYHKAVNYARLGDFEYAYLETKKLLEKNPYYSPAMVLLECVKDAKKEKIPSDLAMLIFKSIITSQDKDKSLNRLHEISKASEIDSTYYLIYLFKGKIFHKNNLLNESLEAYANSIELSPNFGLLYIYRGLVYFEQNMFERSIKDFSRAIELDHKYFEAYWFRAVAYYEKKQYKKSIKDNTMALEINPYFFGSYLLRGDCHFELNQLDDAIEDITKALCLNPKNITSYQKRAEAYKKKGSLDQAIDDYKKILELDESNWLAFFDIARAYERLNQKTNAIDSYQAFLKTVPLDKKDEIEFATKRLELLNLMQQ